AHETGGSPADSDAESFLPGAAVLNMVLQRGPNDATRVVSGCRILIVDDQESNRDLLVRRLARDAHTVTTAANGEEALRLVEEQTFDLILLDLIMPGISGYEVLVRLKSDPRHRDIPVVMISALDQIDSVAGCIEAG